ncbi:Flp pilus assembly protein TadD [Novosphingobium sp. PhB165]|uniref:SPOR domain-containing protein n=1 Tax=Novosphingobium sp. PhB165 TaxID=2485105 RepID=UPI00105393D0|nr:SPOR domain-containing protein [Novosphingobium sp. PhB165]TCM19498.1 Flp pilus assembly protein TadD [Novosphingobium sp. PhB165]
MQRLNSSHARTGGLALGAAMAAALLVSCASHAPVASADAPVTVGAEQGDRDIARAEQRVAKSPRDARSRAMLAQAYLAVGRFDSAATTFEDAISLGDEDAHTALGASLAYIGAGRNAEALALLQRVQDKIPMSDFGLAVALAGQPASGVSILTDVVRGGGATPKARQNLAYAYALDGRWREARLIASQDLTGDQLEARLNEWAASADADKSRERIAGLMGVPLRGDSGQPAMLALNKPADGAQLAIADTPTPVAAAAPKPAAGGELPAVQSGESFWGANQPEESAPAPVPAPARAPAPAAVVRMAAVEAASTTVQPAPAARPAAVHAIAARTVAAPKFAAAQPTTHLVQLGSFRTMDGAKRAWAIFQAQNPKLKDHTMRITEAQVNGQRYYRVAAEGFDRGAAQALCSTVRKGGAGCLAYSQQRALPGASLASR